jgi:uncharacterized membrane protein
MKSQHADNINRQKLHTICKVTGIVGIINFVIFVVVAIIIGGDALNGHEAAGHYYLANHGKLTEVSNLVFVYRKIHATSLFITHPLAMIAGIIYSATGGKRENFWKAEEM